MNAVEILDEFYVMENTIPYILKGSTYDINGKKVKVAKVDAKMLKSLATTDNPFYFYDSNNKKVKAKIGDYLVSPVTLSEIYSVSEEEFKSNFIAQ